MGWREGRHAALRGDVYGLMPAAFPGPNQRIEPVGQDQNELDGIPRIAYEAFDYVIRRPNALSTALIAD